MGKIEKQKIHSIRFADSFWEKIEKYATMLSISNAQFIKIACSKLMEQIDKGE